MVKGGMSGEAAVSACEHVLTSSQLDSSDLESAELEIGCALCDVLPKNRWLCLTDGCDNRGPFCGKRFMDHANEHAKSHGHALQWNVKNRRIWCTVCNCEVYPTANEPPWPMGESLQWQRPTKKTEPAADAAPLSHVQPRVHRTHSAGSSGYGSVVSVARTPDSSFNMSDKVGRAYHDRDRPGAVSYVEDEDEPKGDPRGLTGLRNGGNTCYMNAAVQALSNCVPLSRYMREVNFAAFVVPATGARPGVALHLKELLDALWSRSRIGALMPSKLLMAVGQVYPQFRGWQQQDSQEFLRCFLDLLHQELRQPVFAHEGRVEAPRSSDDADSDNSDSGASPSARRHTVSAADDADDSDHFETADSGLSSSDQDSASGRVTRSQARKRRRSQSQRRERASVGDAHTSGGGRGAKQGAGLLSSALDGKRAACSDNGNKPIRQRSVVTDVFDGYMLSTVKCLTCGHVSETREAFQDLSLPIPSREQLDRLHSSAAPDATAEAKAAGQTEQSYASWLWGWVSWPFVWATSPDMDLQSCLQTFFSADDLRGDDMYSCDKCNKLRNGLKQCSLLMTPEVLCIHLKRFRHDTSYSTKVSTAVRFPLDDLDLSPFLHRENCSKVAKYDLTAIVTHFGGADGGHYVSYCRNEIDGNWYEYDDACVSRVSDLEVLSKEAYVLFYQKNSDAIAQVREKANNLLQTSRRGTRGDILKCCYMSREWLHRLNTFAEPGPITNFDFLCAHGFIPPRKAAALSDYYAEVPPVFWTFLQRRFKGGPLCNMLQHCTECQQAALRLQVKRTAEEAAYHKLERDLDNNPPLSADGLRMISHRWFRQWELFVTGRTDDPPGPVDNSALLMATPQGKRLRPSSNHIRISAVMWAFFVSAYGGGPEVYCMYTCQPEPEPEPMETDPPATPDPPPPPTAADDAIA